MYRRVALLLLALLTYTSPEYAYPGTPLDKILFIYRHADQLLRLPNPTQASDSTALAGFETVIRLLLASPNVDQRDTLFCYSWLKKGILLDAAADHSRAQDAYREVLKLDPKDDSLTFVTNVYAGTGYYYLSNFDSANYFLQKAESMAPGFKNREDEVRLYNILGVLYCDNGNYQQGQNYFKQALRLVEDQRPVDMGWVVNLQTNIATALYKMGLYQEALALYKKMLGYRLSVNYIYQNMGRTYTALDQYPEALACFRRVDAAKVPAVLNEMGYTQAQLGRADSCAWFLDKLHTIAENNPERINRLSIGINQLYRAGLLTDQQQHKAALDCLQQSILIFSRGFSNTDIFSNPTNFTGSFAYYRLFDALFKKAQVFGLLFKTEPKEAWLQGSWQAYTAALSLLRYIEKSYDTDDAKLFLKKKSAGVYDGALAACLQLNRLHPDSSYLEQAFLISEKSKATIIFANLRENAFTGLPGDEKALREMRNIRYTIARLNAQTEETADSAIVDSFARKKAGYEITLARLQKQLERNSAYYKLKYDDSGPGIEELQAHLSPDQALISFYVAAGTLHTFVLTSRSVFHRSDDSVASLQQDVATWVSALKITDNGRKFKAGAVGDRLYQRLVRPIQELTSSKSEWIIVPDGFLYFLPFESLPGGPVGSALTSQAGGASDAGGEVRDFLLQSTTISYRLSSRMLSLPGEGKDGASSGILSFAPFADVSSTQFTRLPSSRDEIAGLPGIQYIDSTATKSNFLKAVDHQSIIHLATHAIASLNNAAGSFIAFYPSKDLPGENNLYLEELYGLNLSAAKLVIISACETGQGELAGKEGVISLSRAFAYAGCASTINSLWKADDKATAYILKRFYVHLEKGDNKAKALQQAKLDYLSSDAVNKSPAYWAHLVVMGDTQPVFQKSMLKWAILLVGLGVVTGIVLGWRKMKRKKAGDLKV